MSFSLDLTDEQASLRKQAHTFARDVIRPVAAEYDRAQEFPWPVLDEAARQGLYGWELYAQLSTDPTGLSLPILMEELFWGCAGIGLSIVPSRDRRPACAVGPGMLRNPRGHQARRAGGDGTQWR
jgi:acyl-CoA dehydrogenase